MALRLATEDGMNRIEGAIGLPDVPALAARLRDGLERGDLDLDLTGVTGIDAGGLQLLLSARAEAAARGRALVLRLPQGGAVPALIARLGLDPAFAAAGRPDTPEQETTR
jgi:ABC-type transporter Mla MlaB component